MTEKERFRITDDVKANWAFQQLAEKQSERNKQLKKYQEFVAQNEEFKERTVGAIDRDIEYFQSLINEYRETLDDKKVNVPAGQTITTKTKSPVYDDEQLLKTVQNKYPEFINSTVAKGDFKKTLNAVNGKYVDENGEVVDGITYEDKETVSFKLNGGK